MKYVRWQDKKSYQMKFPLKTIFNFPPLFTELSWASKIPWINYTATKYFKYEDYVAAQKNSWDIIGRKSRTQSNMYTVITILGKKM